MRSESDLALVSLLSRKLRPILCKLASAVVHLVYSSAYVFNLRTGCQAYPVWANSFDSSRVNDCLNLSTSALCSSMSWGSSHLLNGFSSMVCTMLCQWVLSCICERYVQGPMTCTTVCSIGHFWVNNFLFTSFTCRLCLSPSTQSSTFNCLAFSMWAELGFSLMHMRVSWIWFCMVVIGSHYS